MNYRVKPQLSRSRILLVTLTLLLCVSAPFAVGVFHAQSTTPPVSSLEFEAASIRFITAGQAKDQNLRMGLHCRGVDGELFSDADSTLPLGRCTGITFGEQLVITAYAPDSRRAYHFGVENLPQELDIPTGPDSIMFQIQAIAPNPARVTRAELQLMLQSLLRDRFKLKVHIESRDLDGLNLAVAKGGIKFKKSTAAEQTCCPILPQDGKPFAPDGGRHSIVTRGSVNMQRLAGFVGAMLGLSNVKGPMADTTNLPGLYDVTLQLEMIAPTGGGRGEAPASQPAQFDPPLAKALEEQLGLTLQAGKIPFQFAIVDHIEKPSEN